VRRADGWVVQGLGTAGLLVLLGLGLWLPGWALAHVSDGVAAVFGGRR
jgi:hypothetical protein